MLTEKEFYELVGLYHELKQWKAENKILLTYDENAELQDALNIIYRLTMNIAGKIDTPLPHPEDTK